MIEKAFVLEKGNGKLGHEEQLVVSVLKERAIPFDLFTIKRIRRRQLPLTRDCLVFGDIDCVFGALKQLQIEIPPSESYPEVLRKYLHRRVWESTLGSEERKFQTGSPAWQFIKPRGREKCFTGFVVQSDFDFQKAWGVSRREPVYCSEVVSWLSEFRIYVVNGEIRSVDHYAGDEAAAIDMDVVREAVDTFSRSEEAVAGYSLDFGVLSSGETALIEMNDGFALGAYQIGGSDYTDLTIARWMELMNG